MQRFKDFQPTGFDSRGLGSDGRENWLVVAVSQTRDSGPLDQSNFACTVREIAKVGVEDEDYEVHRFGHWGPGWFEIIVVRPGSEAARVAEEIEDALTDYPVVDEDDFSRREWEAASETWAHCYDLRERIALCAEAGVSIFAARRDEIPQDDSGRIFDALVRP